MVDTSGDCGLRDFDNNAWLIYADGVDIKVPHDFYASEIYEAGVPLYQKYLGISDVKTGNMSLTNKNLAANSNQNVTLPDSCRCLLVINAASATVKGMYIVSTSSAGTVHILEVKGAANVTVSSSTANVLRLANASSNQVMFSFITFTQESIE